MNNLLLAIKALSIILKPQALGINGIADLLNINDDSKIIEASIKIISHAVNSGIEKSKLFI